MSADEVATGSAAGLPASPRCPFCDRTETRLVNPFGSQLSVATYWCNRCRTAFEHIKWAEAGSAPVG